MSKTPSKYDQFSNCYNPKDITSPIKECAGISKTIYNHISNLRNLLNSWISVREKGTQVCRCICSLKLHEYGNDYFPYQINKLIMSLSESLDALENVVEAVKIINLQMEALAKLQSNNEPAINTWSVSEISSNVAKLYEELQKEFRLKQVVTENIAHCRDENLIEVYASAWEFPVYLQANTYAYLFAEVGLT